MDRITENIYIGNVFEAQNIDLLKEHSITAVLNVAFELKNSFSFLDDEICTTHVGLIDGVEISTPAIYAAVLQLGALMKAGHRVLVHCHMGASRSPFVVLCYLRAIGFTPESNKNSAVAEVSLDSFGQNIFDHISVQRSACMINPYVLSRYREIDFDFLRKIILDSKGYILSA